jgi:hypothetical protein
MGIEEVKQEQWAVVELMGHVRLAGRLSQEEHFGAKMGRLDIPQVGGFVTQLFGGGSVYRITFVSEEVARHVAGMNDPAPVSRWDFPRLPSEPPVVVAEEHDSYDEPDDDEDAPVVTVTSSDRPGGADDYDDRETIAPGDEHLYRPPGVVDR